MSQEKEQQELGDQGDRSGASRRKFLEAAARIAVYTPPAMLVMSRPSFAEIQKSGGTTGTSSSTLPFTQQDLSCTNDSGPDNISIVERFCRIF